MNMRGEGFARSSEDASFVSGEINREKRPPDLKVLRGGKETKTDFVKRDAKELAELLSAFVKIDGEKSSVMEAETLYKQLRERAKSKEYADKDALKKNDSIVLDTDQSVIIKFNDLGEEKIAKFSLLVSTEERTENGEENKNYGHYDLLPQYGDKNAARVAGIRD